MASGLYIQGRQSLLEGDIDWANSNIDVLLVTDAYGFDPAEQVVADLVGSELAATDYVRKDLTGRTVTLNGTTVQAAAANVTWSALGNGTNETIGGVVVFLNSGADASSTLIAFSDTADIDTQDTDVEWALAGGVVFTWINT
jgi:hypothetical protein